MRSWHALCLCLCAFCAWSAEPSSSTASVSTDWLRQRNDLVQRMLTAREMMNQIEKDSPEAERMRALIQQVSGRINDQEIQKLAAAQREKAAPSESQIFPISPGTLVIFWSFMAPGADRIAPELVVLRERHPSVVIRQVHVLSLTHWQWFMGRIKVISDRIEGMQAQGQTPSPEILESLWGPVSPHINALMTMQSFFQEPGFLPFANLGMADAMEVDRVITWRYVSTRGVLHRLDGCGPQSDLAGWISRVEELEAHLEEVDRNAGWNRDQEAIMLQRYGAGAKPIPTGTPRASED